MNNRMPKILTSPTKNAREVVNPIPWNFQHPSIHPLFTPLPLACTLVPLPHGGCSPMANWWYWSTGYSPSCRVSSIFNPLLGISSQNMSTTMMMEHPGLENAFLLWNSLMEFSSSLTGGGLWVKKIKIAHLFSFSMALILKGWKEGII